MLTILLGHHLKSLAGSGNNEATQQTANSGRLFANTSVRPSDRKKSQQALQFDSIVDDRMYLPHTLRHRLTLRQSVAIRKAHFQSTPLSALWIVQGH